MPVLIEDSQHFGCTLQRPNPWHSAACTAAAPTAAATASATTAASTATSAAGSILCGSMEVERRGASELILALAASARHWHAAGNKGQCRLLGVPKMCKMQIGPVADPNHPACNRSSSGRRRRAVHVATARPGCWRQGKSTEVKPRPGAAGPLRGCGYKAPGSGSQQAGNRAVGWPNWAIRSLEY